jgi:hypothetical protein
MTSKGTSGTSGLGGQGGGGDVPATNDWVVGFSTDCSTPEIGRIVETRFPTDHRVLLPVNASATLYAGATFDPGPLMGVLNMNSQSLVFTPLQPTEVGATRVLAARALGSAGPYVWGGEYQGDLLPMINAKVPSAFLSFRDSKGMAGQDYLVFDHAGQGRSKITALESSNGTSFAFAGTFQGDASVRSSKLPAAPLPMTAFAGPHAVAGVWGGMMTPIVGIVESEKGITEVVGVARDGTVTHIAGNFAGGKLSCKGTPGNAGGPSAFIAVFDDTKGTCSMDVLDGVTLHAFKASPFKNQLILAGEFSKPIQLGMLTPPLAKKNGVGGFVASVDLNLAYGWQFPFVGSGDQVVRDVTFVNYGVDYILVAGDYSGSLMFDTAMSTNEPSNGRDVFVARLNDGSHADLNPKLVWHPKGDGNEYVSGIAAQLDGTNLTPAVLVAGTFDGLWNLAAPLTGTPGNRSAYLAHLRLY